MIAALAFAGGARPDGGTLQVLSQSFPCANPSGFSCTSGFLTFLESSFPPGDSTSLSREVSWLAGAPKESSGTIDFGSGPTKLDNVAELPGERVVVATGGTNNCSAASISGVDANYFSLDGDGGISGTTNYCYWVVQFVPAKGEPPRTMTATLTLAGTGTLTLTGTAVAPPNPATATTSTTVPSTGSSALAPSNAQVPATSGIARPGRTLVATSGRWVGGVTRYGYEWQLCLGTRCTSIRGATTRRLLLTKADRGRFVRVAVTAYAGSRKRTAYSAKVRVAP